MTETQSEGSPTPEDDMDIFLRSIRSSRLINETRLERLASEFRKSEVATGRLAVALFASILVEKGELTCWQCAKLRNGQFNGFFCDEFKLVDCMGYDRERNYYLAELVNSGRRVVLAFRPDGTAKNYEVLKHF